MDASSDRDFAATFLYACAMTMVHLSRLAEDLIILCGDEHRFFELSDALSTGSSMMPQKKNPGSAGAGARQDRAARSAISSALLTTIKGLPSGYNKDLQEDKEAVFGAEDTLAGCLAVVRSVVGGLTLNRERAAAAASGLAAGDRRCGLPGRTRRAVPARARNRRRAGAQAGRRRARFRVAVARRNGGRPASCSSADIVARVTPRGVGGGQADAAIDRAGGGARPGWPDVPARGWTALGELC